MRATGPRSLPPTTCAPWLCRTAGCRKALGRTDYLLCADCRARARRLSEVASAVQTPEENRPCPAT